MFILKTSNANYLSLWQRSHATQLAVLNCCHDSSKSSNSFDQQPDKEQELFEEKLSLNSNVSASSSLIFSIS